MRWQRQTNEQVQVDAHFFLEIIFDSSDPKPNVPLEITCTYRLQSPLYRSNKKKTTNTEESREHGAL